MISKLKGVEGSFLESWTGWDDAGDFSLQFYGAVYRRDVGLPLDVIEEAERTDGVFMVDCSGSEIYIYYGDEGEKTFSHKVGLTLIPGVVV